MKLALGFALMLLGSVAYGNVELKGSGWGDGSTDQTGFAGIIESVDVVATRGSSIAEVQSVVVHIVREPRSKDSVDVTYTDAHFTMGMGFASVVGKKVFVTLSHRSPAMRIKILN